MRLVGRITVHAGPSDIEEIEFTVMESSFCTNKCG